MWCFIFFPLLSIGYDWLTHKTANWCWDYNVIDKARKCAIGSVKSCKSSNQTECNKSPTPPAAPVSY